MGWNESKKLSAKSAWHGIVTGRVPIEPKWYDFTLQTSIPLAAVPTQLLLSVYTNKQRSLR